VKKINLRKFQKSVHQLKYLLLLLLLL